MINNRQAGRRRGRGGNNNGQRQGGNQGNGSRIDNRARGNATQLYEKYKNMAADAQRAGDRVNTEYYLQFADHYFRVLSEQRGRFEDQQQPRRGRDEFDGDGAGDDGEEFGDEGEPVRGRDGWDGGEATRYANRDGGDRDDRPRDDRPRADRPREDRPREDRPRDDRPREFRREEGESRRPVNGNGDGRREWQDRSGQERSGQDRQERNGQDRGDRQDRPRERRPVEPQGEVRAEGRAEVGGQHRADPVMPGESLAGRAEEVLNADRPLEAPVARRRGRPRRDEAPVSVEAFASTESGDEANGFEADRLPPALGLPPAIAANDEEPAPKPRRRRARPADETPTAAE